MIKIVHNNLTIDICKEARYLKYLPHQKRFVEVKKYMANAVLGSDGNTIYHLSGTTKIQDKELKEVFTQEIEKEEFDKLKSSLTIYDVNEVSEIKKEMDDLKQMITSQNALICQLLEKIK